MQHARSGSVVFAVGSAQYGLFLLSVALVIGLVVVQSAGWTFMDLQVRLVDGPDEREGRLEVRRAGGDWGTVCDDGFGRNEATVVCRQLNFDERGTARISAAYGSGSGTMHLDDVKCQGKETNLGHCAHRGWGRHNCGSYEAVGVDCDPEDLQVRLVDGPDEREGRVEVRRNGSDWGTVCQHNFGRNEATVVCRQLNFGARGTARIFAAYRSGSGTMYLDDVKCQGNETNLAHCVHRGWGMQDCGSFGAVGVDCDPEDLQVRLVDGPDEREGRVEVRRNDSDWGTVCYDGFGRNEATVVCRQLNFGARGTARILAADGSGSATMILGGVWCQGNETNLAHCVHRERNWRNCRSYEAVGVDCDPEDLQVRLVDGPDEREGRVEVRRNGSDWGTVCQRNFGRNEATVVCRQLNIGARGTARTFAADGWGSGTMHLGGVKCQGKETNLAHCTLHGWEWLSCGSFEAPVGVDCDPEDLQVRLVDGPDEREGRVEVRRNGSDWGTVCQYDFGRNEATVVCRQLNFGARGTVRLFPGYGWGSGTMYLDDVKCQGNETNLAHCAHRGWGRHNCRSDEAVGVDCGPEVSTSSGTVPENLTTATATGENGTTTKTMMTTTKSTTTQRHQMTSELQRIQGQTAKPLPESSKTGILKNLTMSAVSQDTVRETKEVLEQQGEMSAADVVYVADILRQASRLQNISRQMATDLLGIVDTVAKLNQSVLQQSNSAANITNTMIQAVEEIADSISLEEGEVRVETNSTVLQVWNLTTVSQSPFMGLQLTSDGQLRNGTSFKNLSDSDTVTGMDTAIVLPGDVGRRIVAENSGHDVRLSVTLTKLTSLFHTGGETDAVSNSTTSQGKGPGEQDRSRVRVRVNSKVISLRITMDGQAVTDLSAFDHGSVTMVFTPLQPVQQTSEGTEGTEAVQCVFWETEAHQGRGGWSTVGCFLRNTVLDKVLCVCDHLTNFAILMDLYGQDVEVSEVHESVLSYISIVGLTFSICGLSVTIVAFILVKKLHKSLPQQTLFNMALAMLCSWVTFLAGITSVKNHVTCVVVAMLLHYFILVTFLWMLAQGVLHYVMLVKGRARPFTRYMLKAGLPAWGLPVIPVIVVSALDVELYRGGDKYCWMSLAAFYYAFLAPIAIIVCINIVIYVLVVVSLCRRPNIGGGGRSYTDISVRASVSCFVVQGLSWVFAFFALEDARVVFQYLFTGTTAFQGLFIFVLYTARDPAVRAFCQSLFRRADSTSAPEQDKPPNTRRSVNMGSTKETSFARST